MISLKQENRKHSGTGEGSSVLIYKGDILVKNLITEEDKVQAYHLRHRIFAQELGWAPQSENGLEIDGYDSNAVYFGVFDNQNRMLAFIRLITSEYPFMVERDFISLIGHDHVIRKERDTVEISRVCIAPEARPDTISGNFGIHRISMFLYKGVYHWCLKHNVRHLYAVVENKVHRLLRAMGFPCKLIGEPKVMPDGAKAVAVIMDWREFEALNSVKRPEMLEWFTQSRSGPAGQQLQQPEVCLQRQASV